MVTRSWDILVSKSKSHMSLILNCFVLGDDPERTLTVEIPKNKNVDILKDRIKEKKVPHFNHIAASDLDLWQVSFAFDDHETELKNINLDRYQKLSWRPWRISTNWRTVDRILF